jgi:formylglycine-generating enzyme required for sulfatase activity
MRNIVFITLTVLCAGYIPAYAVDSNMVLVPGGEFQMGDSFGEGYADELPLHHVYVDSFYMGKYKITNGQYCAFLNSAYPSQLKVVSGIVYDFNDSSNNYPYCNTSTASSYSQIAYSNSIFSVRTKGGRDMSNDPMVMVSWYGSAVYCNWRSQQEGKEPCYNLSTWNCDFDKKGYRLATEAEWEYAARGGLSGKRFPWGDTITHSQANYYSYWSGGPYPYDVTPTPGYHHTWSSDGIMPYTSPVGSFSANGYGLYDMAGNVWDWCNDWYSDMYYSTSPGNNPTGPASGNYRDIRGGGWGSDAIGCRVALRGYGDHLPDYRTYDIGFRIARVAEPPSLDTLVDINPDSLNKNSKGQWVTVYITLPAGYDVGQIVASTIAITSLTGVSCQPDYNQAVDLSFAPQVGDRDEDGIPDLTVKFDRQVLIANLCLDDVAVTVEGKLSTGEHFKGTDHIRVIDRGK